jgi:hypothetical protein
VVSWIGQHLRETNECGDMKQMMTFFKQCNAAINLPLSDDKFGPICMKEMKGERKKKKFWL